MSVGQLPEEDQQEAGGAGQWSLLGFDYQVNVSVWLALDLMVANRLAAEMTLEHVSEEDVEADVIEHEPETVADTVPMRSGYRLIVQCKRRTGNAWTEGGYISLLEHGAVRKSAKVRLEEDATARYLLVTSAALNYPVNKLRVRQAGYWPKADKASARIAGVGDNIAGRLAIMSAMEDDRLLSLVKELLLERFRVPRARWEEALEALRAAAWERMRGEHAGVWLREQVETLIAEHEGYLVSGAEPDDYVQPTNWGDLTAALIKHHALMIIGQSGSGKTATAQALWRERKAAIPDLKHVHITQGPDELNRDKTLPPVFYEIEDPWGRFKFEPDSRPWNNELAPALQSGRHDRFLVATSRLDVANSSGAIDSVERWRMPLDAENYGRAERRALYRNLLRSLPEDLKPFAHEREAAVLQHLSLPLEIRKFFDAVPGLDREDIAKNPALALSQAIEQAHRDSIERTVVDQIGAREAVKPAAILWALIKPHGRLSAEVLRSIEDPLVDADPTLEDRIGSFVNGFITARNLRQGADGSLAYYHGKVEAGIETVLAAHPQSVRRTLRTLVDVLLARDDDMGGSWGLETATEVMHISRRIADATPQLSRASQDRIDALLALKLESEGRDLDRAITLAAAVGSERSNFAEFARWLDYRPDRDFPGMIHWGTPPRDEAWRGRMRDDPAIKALAERFVRTVLPTDNTSFTTSFAADLAAFTGELTDAFVDAALTSAHYGFIGNDNAIAVGALVDLDRFEPVVDVAVEVLAPSETGREEVQRDRLRILNDEVSEEYSEHLASNDDGMTAQAYLEAFVETSRLERGYQSITGHRHFEALRQVWLNLLVKGPSPVPQDGEIETASSLAYGTDDEAALWALLTLNWHERYVALLLDRMVDGDGSSAVRRAALDCFIDHSSARMPEVVGRLAAADNAKRLAELASDLAHRSERRGHDGKDRGDTISLLVDALPSVWQEFARAETAILENMAPALSDEAVTALAMLAEPSEDLRASRLAIALHLDFDAEEDVRWVLAHSEDHDHALAAIDVAVRRDITGEIDAALDHRFAHVAARALTALAAPLAAPLPAKLLAKVDRRSSPVRKALLAQLRAKPHPDHLPTLITLTHDTWQKWEPHGTDDDRFPIARDAVDAITALQTVPEDILSDFIARARTTEDLGLMAQLLTCVVCHGSEQMQAIVVRMSHRGKRVVVGRAAADALLSASERLSGEIVASITDELVLTLPAMIAGYHVATIGLQGTAERIDGLARKLAESEDRRIFLALLAMARRDRDADHSLAIAALLPDGHPARRWALGEDVKITRDMLIDLGDASAVKEAMTWMKSEK